MELPEEYHDYLMVTAANGDLSPEEKVVFDELIKETEFRTKYEKILSDCIQSESKLVIQSKNWAPATVIIEKGKSRRRKRIFRQTIYTSTIMLVVFSFFLLNNNSRRSYLGSENRTKVISVHMILADGSFVAAGSDENSTTSQKGVLLGTKHLDLRNVGQNIPSGVNKIIVPNGYNYHILLSDGSEVWLNSGTTFSFPSEFRGANRNVSVEGEAYFKIAKKSNSAFEVSLPKSIISVLGTEFNINTYTPENEVVSLVNGKVKLGISFDTISMQPGEIVNVNYIKKTYNIKSNDISPIGTWREGLYYFSDANFDILVNEVSRIFGVTVKAEGVINTAHKFTGGIDRKIPFTKLVSSMQYFTTNTLNYDSAANILTIK